VEKNMKSTINVVTLFTVLFAATICATADDKKKADDAPAPASASAPQTVTIPKDAVANPDGLRYSYTDKQGKQWMYTKTPFGIIKAPLAEAPQDSSTTKTPFGISRAPATATPATEAPAAKRQDVTTKAIDKGDTVRFERPSPFGPVSWEKKKSELTDAERHILDAQTAKTEAK
jgi:hypothetical protein